MTPTPIRRTALVLVAAAVPLLVAGPASAEVPVGWSEPDEVGFLALMLVIGGIPLALAILIGLAVYLPALARGETVKPGADVADQWFGGPRREPAELESPESGRTGGGRGTW